MKQICRVCLQEGKCTFDIYDEKLNVNEIMQQHMPFQFPDEYSVVCANCWDKLSSFHEFYLTVEEMQTNYWQQIVSGDVEVKLDINPLYEPEVAQVTAGETEKPAAYTSDTLKLPVYEDGDIVEEQPEEYIEEEEDSYADDDHNDKDFDIANAGHDDDDDDDSENDDDNTLIENDDANNSHNDFDKDANDNDDDDDNDDADADEADDDNDNADDVDYSVGSTKSTQRRKAVAKTKKNANKSKTKPVKRKQAAKRQQLRPNTSLTDAEILKKHITMLCDICCFIGETFADLCNHIDIEHAVIPYVVCCGRKIKKHHRVVQHAYKHEDPNIYKCEACDKNFFDAYTFKSHMIFNHPDEKELNYKCDKCDRRFSRQHLLNLHTPTHIPPEERTFVCEKCPDGKTFASKHLLQIHEGMTHKRTKNICHVCAKEIRDMQAFKKHVRLHFEDSGPRVKCPQPGCDSWLKDKDNLKQHLRRHNIEGKIYSCPQCNKICKNRSALTGHLRYAHTNEEFICDVCKKSFRKAITLKEHMAQHTGESLYKCPFCNRTFNSSANMHSHKKKKHPVEWDMWRKTKRGSSQHEESNQHVLQLLANGNTKYAYE